MIRTLSIALAATLPLVLVCVAGCDDGAATPVGVTLDDGQILIGEVTTETLWLDSAMGPLAIPLDDVGMLIPVEERTVGAANDHVTVWLRNGSELRGSWQTPDLDMALLVGGEHVPVDLPTDRLQALQLQGSEHWPEGDLYRVTTTHGDDFLVDGEASRITIENELGTFSPFLSECRRAQPIGDPEGDWRVVLDTGTVLVGPLSQSELTLALPLGPDEITVPLTALVSLERGAWQEDSPPPAAAEKAGSYGVRAQRQAPSATPALSEDEGWFRNELLESAKQR